jgi:hypothetical protein
MKLTDPQRRELERLAKESPAENSYTGRVTSRVRNSLRVLGLVRFFNQDGSEPNLVTILVSAGHGSPYDTCEITEAGRAALKHVPRGESDVQAW